MVSDMGAPQETALSDSLFTVYTLYFTCNSKSSKFQKLYDDSAIVGWISEGKEADWCHKGGHWSKYGASGQHHNVLVTHRSAFSYRHDAPQNTTGNPFFLVDSRDGQLGHVVLRWPQPPALFFQMFLLLSLNGLQALQLSNLWRTMGLTKGHFVK